MDQGPVLIITFQAQLVMVIRNTKGEVVEGDPVSNAYVKNRTNTSKTFFNITKCSKYELFVSICNYYLFLYVMLLRNTKFASGCDQRCVLIDEAQGECYETMEPHFTFWALVLFI